MKLTLTTKEFRNLVGKLIKEEKKRNLNELFGFGKKKEKETSEDPIKTKANAEAKETYEWASKKTEAANESSQASKDFRVRDDSTGYTKLEDLKKAIRLAGQASYDHEKAVEAHEIAVSVAKKRGHSDQEKKSEELVGKHKQAAEAFSKTKQAFSNDLKELERNKSFSREEKEEEKPKKSDRDFEHLLSRH